MTQVRHILSQHAQTGGGYALLETAGGILSPAPSGTLQADLYRPLRLPVVLIGDSKLGGIATTISAFESLHVRGYDVDAVMLFQDDRWGNAEYLDDHFSKYDIKTFSISPPPPQQANPRDDESKMLEYYESTALTPSITNVVELIHKNHFERISKLFSMQAEAESIIWHPFRQHQLPQDIVTIDSAYGDQFDALYYSKDESEKSHSRSASSSLQSLTASGSGALTIPLFDGSASWWTQGLGHGNPDLSLTAAYAAGRYGHVMFANAIHQPALDISYTLLSTLANPRLSRVFFTDNGSTGMEVAVKMALRASCARYGWDKQQGEIGILGLSGSYHGDTIGVMNCSEPNVFNEKVDWHQPWGYWFDAPNFTMSNGRWHLNPPNMTEHLGSVIKSEFATLKEVFDFRSRENDAQVYEKFIKNKLDELIRVQNRRFGALIMEPVLMGAGGMIFVDPLFQRTLIRTIRQNPSLISSDYSPDRVSHVPVDDWTGLPVIADEVFTGLYRLGRPSSSSFLSSDPTSNQLENETAPDISVHAKLLTGGLVPLAITTASDSIFRTFLSERKQDALLHGHSYTAHAIGCTVADKSLRDIRKLNEEGGWAAYKSAWDLQDGNRSRDRDHIPATLGSPTFSFFSPSFLEKLSYHENISGCFAIGTVLAMTLKSESSGYTSTAAASLQKRLLLDLDEEGAGIHSRVLGDVLYIMTSLTTSPDMVHRIEKAVIRALG